VTEYNTRMTAATRRNKPTGKRIIWFLGQQASDMPHSCGSKSLIIKQPADFFE
jgi:hypothetical protein